MRRRTRIRAGLALACASSVLALGVACGSTLQGSLNLVTGPDNAFLQTPVPTSLRVQLITDGQAITIGEAGLPTNGLTLPAQSSATIDTLKITGFDEQGDAVVSGSTIPLALDQLSDITLNLFMQRTGAFSRLPSADGGTATLDPPTSGKPLLTTLFSRYLLISDGTGKSTATQLYDTLSWQFLPAPPPLPLKPLSLAYLSGYTGSDASADATASFAALLTIGANGASAWLDLTDSVSPDAQVIFEAGAPDGGSFGAVAGGQSVIDSDDGSVFIVGATRASGTPTTAILHVTTTGLLQWMALGVARLGAAATYVPGVGLYVFGGNAVVDGGASGAGAELFAAGTSTSTPLTSVATDTTTGAAAVALDGSHVLLAGGVTAKGVAAEARLYATSTLAGETGAAGVTRFTVPEALVLAQVFALRPTTASNGWAAMVVGSESSGKTVAYTLTANAVTYVPFRVPRAHGVAIILPNGSLAVVGADATTLESFIP